jgi:Tfp pilus assembly protein PilP
MHQKGIEMKLIQILALATAMATMATAQNSSANGQNSGGAKPSPTATPAAATSNAKKKPGSKTSATTAAKTGTGTSAKATSQATSTKPVAPAKGGTAAGSANKVVVKTGSAPVTGKSGATVQPASPVVKVKATPTPAVPAKSATAAKTDAKKSDVKKPAAVIAVKPPEGTKAKKTGAAQAKAPAKTPAKTPPPTVTQVGSAAKPPEKPKPVTRAFGAHGRRDPFVSPIRVGGSNTPVPNCTTGKRCLAIPELVLQGTIKDMTGKMMAVVANSTKHTYFLRENDQVFNGSVEKITSDSIIFREYVKDAMGRETAREVVKKLVPTT